jgi:DNA transposition AAA+ family ATPase
MTTEIKLTDPRPTATDQPDSSPGASAGESKDHRINIPLNLANWKHLPESVRELLLWFHQFVIDHSLSFKDAGTAIGYDNSVVWRVLKGEYNGNYENVCSAISKFRQREERPLTLKKYQFAENSITQLIWNGLSYALNNQVIVLLIGESGLGKSVATQHWKQRNNHGKSVLIRAPFYGGTKALLREIGKAVGANLSLNCYDLHQAVLNGFNSTRILVVDEAHQLLPGSDSSKAVSLEILRDIHDRTGCGLALIATARLREELKKGKYLFEQLVGRSRPIILPRNIKPADVEAIARQWIKRPSETALNLCVALAEKPGRLRNLTDTLKSPPNSPPPKKSPSTKPTSSKPRKSAKTNPATGLLNPNMNLRSILPTHVAVAEELSAFAQANRQLSISSAEEVSEPVTVQASPTGLLLKCPFCGHPPTIAFHETLFHEPGPRWSIGCTYKTCHAGPIVVEPTLPQAIVAWNKRS